jgi:hypothetical protein
VSNTRADEESARASTCKNTSYFRKIQTLTYWKALLMGKGCLNGTHAARLIELSLWLLKLQKDTKSCK